MEVIQADFLLSCQFLCLKDRVGDRPSHGSLFRRLAGMSQRVWTRTTRPVWEETASYISTQGHNWTLSAAKSTSFITRLGYNSAERLALTSGTHCPVLPTRLVQTHNATSAHDGRSLGFVAAFLGHPMGQCSIALEAWVNRQRER